MATPTPRRTSAFASFTVFASLLAMITLLPGCYSRDLERAVGHYEGLVTDRAGARTDQQLITGDISSPKAFTLVLKASTADKPPRQWELTLTLDRSGNPLLTDPAARTTTPLKWWDGCYIDSTARRTEDAAIRLCYEGAQGTLQLPARDGKTPTIILKRSAASNVPKLEPPRDFSLSEITRQAVNRSFTSQIEFQNVVQARLNSVNAHMNLIPHFSLGDVLSLATITGSMVGLVRLIGNLVPFLIPSNWFKAREAKFRSIAEQWGYQLMKADSGNVAAGLSYGIVRDQLSLERMRLERAQIAEIRAEIYDRERLGFLPEGSTDSVDAVLVACDKMILLLTQTIEQDLGALSLASGYFNPKAVRSVLIDSPATIEKPEAFDSEKLSQLALNRSAELKQMDSLISAARTQQKQRYFDWLDPSGAGASIGFGMGSYIGIAAAQVQQTIIKRQQLQAQLLQNVANTNILLNNAVEAYALSQRNTRIQSTRVETYLKQIRLGISVSTTDLINAFGGEMQAQIDGLNARFQYLVARENIERLLYHGPYQGLGADGRPGAGSSRVGGTNAVFEPRRFADLAGGDSFDAQSQIEVDTETALSY